MIYYYTPTNDQRKDTYMIKGPFEEHPFPNIVTTSGELEEGTTFSDPSKPITLESLKQSIDALKESIDNPPRYKGIKVTTAFLKLLKLTTKDQIPLRSPIFQGLPVYIDESVNGFEFIE